MWVHIWCSWTRTNMGVSTNNTFSPTVGQRTTVIYSDKKWDECLPEESNLHFLLASTRIFFFLSLLSHRWQQLWIVDSVVVVLASSMTDGCCVPSGQSDYSTERHVVESAGRVGSLYNIRTDRVIDVYSSSRLTSKPLRRPAICQILSGHHPSKSATSYLEQLGFDPSLRENVDSQVVKPAGLSLLINYEELINRGTRFLFYSYRGHKEKLRFKTGKADRVAPPPQANTAATHMITKITWGIEVLCVLQVPPDQYIEVFDQALERVRTQLLKYRRPIQISTADQHLFKTLKDIAVYGSEICIDQPNISLLTVLSRIRDWQENVDLYQPLEYTLLSLQRLYPRLPVPDPSKPRNEQDSQLQRIPPLRKRIAEQIQELEKIVADLPADFSSPVLNRCSQDERQEFRALLDTQRNLNDRLDAAVKEIHQERQDASIINEIIASPGYASLHAEAITQLHTKVARLVSKAQLIDQLTNDGIRYVNAADVYPSEQTLETKITDIHQVLTRTFSKAILWYSSDRLRRKQEGKWKQTYREVLSSKDRRERLDLIYVDFTYCRPYLEDFAMIKLLVETRPEPKEEHLDSSTGEWWVSFTSSFCFLRCRSRSSSNRAERSPGRTDRCGQVDIRQRLRQLSRIRDTGRSGTRETDCCHSRFLHHDDQRSIRWVQSRVWSSWSERRSSARRSIRHSTMPVVCLRHPPSLTLTFDWYTRHGRQSWSRSRHEECRSSTQLHRKFLSDQCDLFPFETESDSIGHRLSFLSERVVHLLHSDQPSEYSLLLHEYSFDLLRSRWHGSLAPSVVGPRTTDQCPVQSEEQLLLRQWIISILDRQEMCSGVRRIASRRREEELDPIRHCIGTTLS